MQEVPLESSTEVTRGPIMIDLDRPRVTLNGERVVLTRIEYLLLRALMLRPNTPLTLSELARAAWGHSDAAAGRRIATHVHRLRTKLGMRNERALPQIRPERNWGYELLTGEAVAG